MFIPTTKSEISRLGWDSCDVILVSGDAYIDTPYDGIAAVGKWLMKNGFRVGIISQPDIFSHVDISRLGSPNLFWGVSGGCVDSMVANYTASKKKRHLDDLTPGGENTRRPDRAVIKYVNLIKQYFKSSKPIIIGGIEASLRRVAHYDYWDDSIRRSILFDSKADFLVYGMGEKTLLQIANNYRDNKPIEYINGICYISGIPANDYIELPSFEKVKANQDEFTKMFDIFYHNNDPITAKGLQQKTGERYLIQNPPQSSPTSEELDEFYDLDYEYDAHPYYKSQGKIKSLDTIKQSITSHRGCFGECNFCAIAVHQGRRVISRSEESILNEVQKLAKNKDFNGIIYDVGGPTANMYGMQCKKMDSKGACKDMRCIFPDVCNAMDISHSRYTKLLDRIRSIKGVKKVFVSSGLRYDLIMHKRSNAEEFMHRLAEHHVSGQLKIAPEHLSNNVLHAMGKPIDNNKLLQFKEVFTKLSAKYAKKQFITYYFIASHPACNVTDMVELKDFLKDKLKAKPEQAQIFTPTPSTYSTVMFYTNRNPFSGEHIFVEKNPKRKQTQKDMITFGQAATYRKRKHTY